MKPFMNKDFLLETPTAVHLYETYAKDAPIVDYHCHISPREIYENRRFENLAQVWLGGKNPDGSYFGDHYKWRVMRSAGVPEEYITGDRPDEERFQKFAEALPLAIGNPMVHWCHLELRTFFGCDQVLNGDTAQEIWAFCNQQLQQDDRLTVRGLIERSNVRMIGTTDDPTDTLEWHQKLQALSLPFAVYPSFRPDKAINIQKPGFADYLQKLAQSAGEEKLSTVEDVCRALSKRLEVFAALGCRASDHGLDTIPYAEGSMEEANRALSRALSGEALSEQEIERYQTKVLLHLAREYHRLGIVMQLHYSCIRNLNERLFARLGPDTGFDAIGQTVSASKIAALLSALDAGGECPKTILYSLNPADNEMIGSIIGCFQDGSMAGKIQQGSAWWFNDHKIGMEQQLCSLANLGVLGTFVGMLTDSRSFLSYTRHDYFRRILCNLVGGWVERGEYPNDEAALRTIIRGICFENALRYFRLE